MTSWIWTIPSDKTRLPYAEFDYLNSTIQSYQIVSMGEITWKSLSDIVVLMPRILSRRLSGLNYIPNHHQCPLVDDLLAQLIVDFAGDEVQVLPVTLKTRDAEILRYSFARPKVALPCTDLDASIIDDWIVPGESIMDARHLVFKPDCLGDKHFARDTYTSHIVVSDMLKDALMATGAKGLTFCLPEDMWNIFRDRD
ncbi:imm11 family protein [Rhizobium herbae]|uniref:Immunity MXAN-0049 protein domain-containing protein n=1 Tax=Rhizobium herbae TaxID=508661 RepID=A0ABS4EGD0_9HYPH|nr:DUF1629 domain-containing protein [Rhizobium herbae]MBP1856999.1 hypothetical protein [Rhizobium herbae]